MLISTQACRIRLPSAAGAKIAPGALAAASPGGATTAPAEKRGAMAAYLRRYAAQSPEHAAALFMSTRRWTFAGTPRGAA